MATLFLSPEQIHLLYIKLDQMDISDALFIAVLQVWLSFYWASYSHYRL